MAGAAPGLQTGWRALFSRDGRRQIAQRLLAQAASTGNVRLLSLAIGGGAQVNAPLMRGITALHIAAQRGDAAAAALLLRKGADADSEDQAEGFTPLMLAVRNDREAMLRQLIAAGAQVDRAGATGLWPLMLAAMYGKVGMAEILLRHGADPGLIAAKAGTTVLHAAVHENNVHMVDLLVRYGANPDLAAANGVTPRRLAEVAQCDAILALLAR